MYSCWARLQGLPEGLAEIQRRKADPSLPSGAREQQPTSEGGRYMTTGARGLALAGPKTRHWDAPFASLRLGRAKARPYHTLRRRRRGGEKTTGGRGPRAGRARD